MSLKPESIGGIPAETARIAKLVFAKGNVYLKMRDEFGVVYEDEDLSGLYPSQGQPALSPCRLALVTVMLFMENLTDRQAAEAVRARIDWKYCLGLELEDRGFDYSVLSEFRERLVEGHQEKLWYTIYDFQSDWDSQVATCPQGKPSFSWKAFSRLDRGKLRNLILVRFSRTDCLPCAARERCFRSQNARQLTIQPKETFQLPLLGFRLDFANNISGGEHKPQVWV